MSAKSVTTDSKKSEVSTSDYLMGVALILQNTRDKVKQESATYLKLYANLIGCKDAKNIDVSQFHFYLGQIKSALDGVSLYIDFCEKHLAPVIKKLEETKSCRIAKDNFILSVQDEGEPPSWVPIREGDDFGGIVDRETFEYLKANRYNKPCDRCPDEIKDKCEYDGLKKLRDGGVKGHD